MLTQPDIDYMDSYKVFTLGERFPLNEMRSFISNLHGNDQHYIVMVDPGWLHLTFGHERADKFKRSRLRIMMPITMA
jgi:hypothetical protein